MENIFKLQQYVSEVNAKEISALKDLLSEMYEKLSESDKPYFDEKAEKIIKWRRDANSAETISKWLAEN